MDYLTMDENVCPVCGKVFYTVMGREWGWGYKGSRYCSYHCMRHVEIRHRVQMGWQRNPLCRKDDLSAAAREVAEELTCLRHLRRAADELGEAARGDRSLAPLGNGVEAKADERLAMWQPLFDALDEGKKRLAYALFVDGLPARKVAEAMDVDVDLLSTKLRLLYEKLAGVAI